MAILTTIVHKRKMSLKLKVQISKILKNQNDTFSEKYPSTYHSLNFLFQSVVLYMVTVIICFSLFDCHTDHLSKASSSDSWLCLLYKNTPKY